jgi:hypothetical protein
MFRTDEPPFSDTGAQVVKERVLSGSVEVGRMTPIELGIEDGRRVTTLLGPVPQVVGQRIQARRSDVRVPGQIPGRAEQRRGVAPLGGTVVHVMTKGIPARFGNVGVSAQVPVRVEDRSSFIVTAMAAVRPVPQPTSERLAETKSTPNRSSQDPSRPSSTSRPEDRHGTGGRDWRLRGFLIDGGRRGAGAIVVRGLLTFSLVGAEQRIPLVDEDGLCLDG